MTNFRKSGLLKSLLITVSSTASVSAWAEAPQDQTTLAPDTIVVTANKRTQNVQDVGIAITALGNDSLDRIQKSDITQIAKIAPSLQVQQYSPTLTIFNIRGVSQNDFGDYQEAPIAFYNDEVYIASLGAIAGQTFDLERVEVLRGPQGTLFGRNATGGLVQAISAKPTAHLTGFATVSAGSYGQFSSEAAISGPLSDRIRGRLSFTSDRNDGYIHNTIGRSQGTKNFFGGRAQIEADVGDTGKLRVKAELLRDVNERPTGYRNVPVGTDADCRGTISTAVGVGGEACYDYLPFLPNYGYVPSSDPFRQAYNTNSHFDRTYWNLTARYEQEFGNVTFSSISNYQNLKKSYADDADASPFEVLTTVLHQKFYQLSQEFRLYGKGDRLNWTTGIYGLKLHSDNPQQIGLPPLGYLANILAVSDTKSVALFGQAEYKIDDVFTLIGGARYSWDWKDFDLAERTQQLDSEFNPIEFDYVLNKTNFPGLAHKTYKNYSGKIELDAKLNHDTLVYLSVNRGTKSGGFNTPYVVLAANPPAQKDLVYDQEVLTNFEGGVKLKLLNNKVTFNSSVFHYKYDDYQAFSFTGGNSTLSNHPARITGVEAELSVRPVHGLNLSAFVSHLAQAKVYGVVLPSGRITDTRMPQAPKWSVGWSADLSVPVSDMATAKLSTSWKYDSAQYFTALNAPVDRESSRVVGDVRLSLELDRPDIEVSLMVNNVTDRAYRVFNSDNSFIGVGQSTYARPRWFGGTITYRFGN